MKVQLYVVDSTHGWDYVTNYIDTKTMKENLFLAKMTLKMHFCSSIHFLLKPIFVLSTQAVILLDQRQYIFMHYIVFLSASINGFGDYYYYELYICESERIP